MLKPGPHGATRVSKPRPLVPRGYHSQGSLVRGGVLKPGIPGASGGIKARGKQPNRPEDTPQKRATCLPLYSPALGLAGTSSPRGVSAQEPSPGAAPRRRGGGSPWAQGKCRQREVVDRGLYLWVFFGYAPQLWAKPVSVGQLARRYLQTRHPKIGDQQACLPCFTTTPFESSRPRRAG